MVVVAHRTRETIVNTAGKNYGNLYQEMKTCILIY